jgi:hypothetical protein
MFSRISLTALILASSSLITIAPAAQANTTEATSTPLTAMAKAVEINRLAVALRLSQKQLVADKKAGSPKDVIEADLPDLHSKESAFNRVAGLD